MKTCPNCQAALKDEAVFCANCGAQYAEPIPQAAPIAEEQPVYSQPVYSQPEQPMYSQPVYSQPMYNPEQPISVGGWIGRSLIPCIPVVGGIVYLIMLFVWMGDSTKQETFRNWAKAQLIVLLIMVVLGVLVFAIGGAAIFSMLSEFSDSMAY